ncbi:MAG: hypothetical protein KJ000_25355 [Pirellulaceae bacterium]|nr:hypothetical protein [Pirellulaceae bacterium]
MTRCNNKAGFVGCLAALVVSYCAPLPADDVFVLENGGRIHGRWQNRNKDPDENFAIQLREGGRLTLSPAQVQRAIVEDPRLDEYRQVAACAEDTVAGHSEMAQWCRQRGLEDQRQIHLQRIIELDPDHAVARRELGYTQIRGRWVTRQQHMESRGFERHAGRWRLPQDIQIIEELQESDRVRKDWLLKLRRWRAMMATEGAGEAYRQVAAVADPIAVSALRQLLAEEPYRQVKMLYIEVLGKIGDPASTLTLAEASLRDPDEEIFHACLKQLIRNQPPHIAKPYLDTLKDGNNVRLNRAGYALGRLGDRSCIPPLIDSLITTHYVVLPSNPNTHTATFARPAGSGSGGPLGGTGFSSGEPPPVIARTVRNEEVLQSLILLSGGVNFGFDQRAWNSWLANENRQAVPAFDARRENPDEP